MEALGFIGIVGVLIGLLWALLTFCIPFMLYAILGHLKEMKKAQASYNNSSIYEIRKLNAGVERIETNVYASTEHLEHLNLRTKASIRAINETNC